MLVVLFSLQLRSFLASASRLATIGLMDENSSPYQENGTLVSFLVRLSSLPL